MASQKIIHKFVVYMFVVEMYLFEAEATLKITSLEDICIGGKSNFLHLSSEETGILKSEPKWNPIFFDCEIVLLPDTISHAVVLSIYKYNIQSQYSQLTIEDSSGYKIALLGSGKFDDERKSIISDGKIVIHYKRDKLVVPIITAEVPLNETMPPNKEGFQFTFTQVRNSPCRENEFSCKNGKCLTEKYTCDRHNHCGDNSDQRNCVIRSQPVPKTSAKSNIIWISTVIAAGGVLIILIAIYSTLLLRYSKNKLNDASSNENRSNGNINNAIFQLVSLTVSTNPSAASSSLNRAASASASNGELSEASLYDRVRSYLRTSKDEKVDEQIQKEGAGPYQVPPMYPNLDTPIPYEMQGD